MMSIIWLAIGLVILVAFGGLILELAFVVISLIISGIVWFFTELFKPEDK